MLLVLVYGRFGMEIKMFGLMCFDCFLLKEEYIDENVLSFYYNECH